MKPKLVTADPQTLDQLVREFLLDDLPIVVGRSARAGVRLEHPWVSGLHCEIDTIDGTLVVRDLGSKHGTFRNGAPIREALLMPGDILTIGTLSFVAAYQRHPALPCPAEIEPPPAPSDSEDAARIARLQLDQPPAEQLEHLLVEDLKRSGVSPTIIQAFEKTGLLITEQNQHLFSEEDLARWDQAILEYEAQQDWPEDLEFPLATVALYGPNLRHTTKILVAIIPSKTGQPILRQWIGSTVRQSRRVERAIQKFLNRHNVETIIATNRNVGCMHEEGADFPAGEECPFCPYWKGKQGIVRKVFKME